MARPRKFREDEVLDRAMRIFWRKGYDGTSTAELLDAMGMTNSSLYKAFGSKEQLYGRVVGRYHNGPLAFRSAALGEPTPWRVVESVLLGTVDLLSRDGGPQGCLEVAGGLPADAPGVRDLLVGNRSRLRRALEERLTAVATAGPMPGGLSPAGLAALVATLAHGLAVQAADGIGKAELAGIAQGMLRSWQPEA